MADDELRAQAIVSLKRKRKFWGDALGYLAVNALLWVIWAITDRSTGGSLPWPAWISIGWGFFLGLDALRAYTPVARRTITEADIEREMRHLLPH